MKGVVRCGIEGLSGNSRFNIHVSVAWILSGRIRGRFIGEGFRRIRVHRNASQV